MSQHSRKDDQIQKLQLWEEIWQRRRKQSHLKETQRLNPEKWQTFYDRVSSLWDEITGFSGNIGNAVARFIVNNRLASTGSSVLDIGCGPGALSLALADRGIAVTALDNSPGMIHTLEETICKKKIHGITTRLVDWRKVPAEPKYDLTAACFFPDAFSSEGLSRMESFTAGVCLLVLGDGKDAFPIRKEIWKKVMNIPIPGGNFNFICAKNYLRVAGRMPLTEKLKFPVSMDVELSRMENYYREYFAIFKKSDYPLHHAISETLAPFINKNNRVHLEGVIHLNILWWKPFTDQPILPWKNF